MWAAGGRTAPGARAVISSTARAILDCLRALAWPVIVGGVGLRYLALWKQAWQSHRSPEEREAPTRTAGRSRIGPEAVRADEEAEALIHQAAPELVSTVIERLQAEHAMEFGQAEQQAHDVIERLLRKLATTEIRADFESIYARIHGSQGAALQTLREAPNGAPRASVEAHLAQVKNDVSTRLVVCRGCARRRRAVFSAVALPPGPASGSEHRR
jgi:hypothetical protein